jgi:Family of unknown function (DUF6508)
LHHFAALAGDFQVYEAASYRLIKSFSMPYFNGYCPECLLRGQQVPMKTNLDGFLECPESGLQIALSATYATILRWRGKGQFGESAVQANPGANGLLLAEAKKEEEQETLPDEENLLPNEQALEWYLHELYDNYKVLKAHQFNTKDPVFNVQMGHLSQLKNDQWQKIFGAFLQFCNTGITINIKFDRSFRQWHQLLQQTGLIFDFNWHAWHRGWVNIRNPRFNYQKATLLELSMYLSAIFLSEPYDEGTIEFYFNNKTLEKLMSALEEKALASSPLAGS